MLRSCPGVVLAGSLAMLVGLAGCGDSSSAPGPLTETPEAVARPNVLAICKTLTEERAKFDAAMHVVMIQRLAKFGASAVAAVPTLEKLAKEDADEKIRQAATEALAAIQGGGAAPAPPANP